jgi:tripartite-type tricarboxylate transporter receptor subunit TctC
MIRRLLAFIAALATTAAFAQGDYPGKPIKLIVPFPPAGGTDTLSRAIAQSIATDTKWTIVVENRPGAGGNIGLDAAAKSPPDGYTIAMGQTANLAVNPALYSSMPFDPLKDFAPIALLSSQPLIVVVSATSPTSR